MVSDLRFNWHPHYHPVCRFGTLRFGPEHIAAGADSVADRHLLLTLPKLH